MNLPDRKLHRLTKYNYANDGYYYVTICTHNKSNLFWNINSLNEMGEIAKTELESISTHFIHVRIDKYVIMPNHIHGVFVIGCGAKAERSRPFPTLSTVVGLYKSGVSRLIHELSPKTQIWQRGFHDHIIRDEGDYLRIWQYIDENPAKWTEDEYYHYDII